MRSAVLRRFNEVGALHPWSSPRQRRIGWRRVSLPPGRRPPFLHAGGNRACHEQFFAVIFHDPQQAGDTGREVEELEHVPSQLNQGDSLGAKDERVYRH